MPENITNPFTEDLRERLRIHEKPDLDLAVYEVRSSLESKGFSLSAKQEKQLKDAASSLVDEVRERIRLLRVPSVLSAGRQANWYSGSSKEDIHWPAFAKWLKEIKGWDDDTIESIKLSSHKVTAALGNPKQAEFSCFGLVVGHVQSGKTANMTAVIARAVDAGYNFIIILAGMTDKLRHQTQARIENDLYKRNPHNWHPLTSTNDYDDSGNLVMSGDYRGQSGRKLPNPHPDQAYLAIIKKWGSILRKLLRDLQETPPAIKNRYKVLIIDDETDQGSVNTASGDDDITTINGLIRQLVVSFPAASYVGYTATPFANVLINPFPPQTHKFDNQHLEDLYPRDFIIALPSSDKYFGTERLFGRDPVDANEPYDDGLDVIRQIRDEERALLLPRSTKAIADFVPAMTESLETALRYFLLACAARRARDQHTHMTMLVHTHHMIAMHNSTHSLIAHRLNEIRQMVANADQELTTQLQGLWEEECNAVPDHLTDAPKISYEQLASQLPDVLNGMKLVTENSLSEERLNFTGSPRPWIVVGGNILARGLTLEGLMVSYFLRASKQYDTLLQMGRWFGYREGYEDFPRIWMTNSLSDNFRRLATVEHEIRKEIEEYAERKAIPLDFAVRIRSYPSLTVTAKNKMRNAVTADVNYAGLHVQTIRYDRENIALQIRNWQAGADLLTRINDKRDHSHNQPVFRDVSFEDISIFLRSYEVHSSHRDLSSNWLLGYMGENLDIHEKWNVVLTGSSRVSNGQKPLGPIAEPRRIRRSRLKGTDNNLADIKALMSRGDILLDCPSDEQPAKNDWNALKHWREEQLGQRPLLLLYVIDKDSAPTPESKTRVPLEAVHDILGLGIVFPSAGQRPRGRSFRIQVKLEEQELDAEDAKIPDKAIDSSI